MKKHGLKRTMAAGLAALAVFGTAAALPMTAQKVYAGEAELPTETNTTFSKAREIIFSTSMAGTLSKSDSLRYYKFSLGEASRLDLGFEKSYDGHNMYIKIYDDSQTEIYSVRNGSKAFSLNAIYLTGGNYYMTVEEDRDLTFSFVANVDSMGESFTETQDSNNDMSSDASVISLKKNYKGVLAWNDDIDYYKFQSPAAGHITFNLTNSTSETVKYGVYDQSLNPAYTNTVRSGDKISQQVSVKKGTYYLAVSKNDLNRVTTGSYTFSIDHTKKISAAPKIKSVKNSSYGTMTIKWGAVTGASGYELWYSTKSNFKSDVSKNELDSYAASASYNWLTKGKTYYVRIRAYTVINGVKEYGKWSSSKSVAIKK